MIEKRISYRVKVFILPFLLACTLIYFMVPLMSSKVMTSRSKVIRDAWLFDENATSPSAPLGDKKNEEGINILWERGVDTNASHYIHLKETSSLLRPRIRADLLVRDLLYGGKPSPKSSILIVCHSKPSNFAQRDAIRDTWGTTLDVLPVTLIFLLGKTRNNEVQKGIEMESFEHEDILQEDFLDSYHILSIKSVFMLKYIKYLSDLGVPVRYVFKLDDDCYLNPKALLKFMSIADRHPFTIFGKSLGDGSPVHRPGSNADKRWTVPQYLYKKDVYPNAASGSGYFFDLKAGLCLYRQAMKVPLINLEDIFLTGLLRVACDIHLRNNSKFHFMGKKICDVRGSDILIHHVKSIPVMYNIHELINGVSDCHGKKIQSS